MMTALSDLQSTFVNEMHCINKKDEWSLQGYEEMMGYSGTLHICLIISWISPKQQCNVIILI